MKNLLLLFIGLNYVSILNAQNNSWSLGLSLSSTSNYSKFKEGNQEANAKFHQNDFNGGEWQISVRKGISEHLFLQSGLGISSLGFQTALTQNYSLLNKEKHYVGIKQSWNEGMLPVMAFYQSKLNCRNWKWVGGLGTSLRFHSKSETKKDNQLNETSAKNGNTSFDYFQQTNVNSYTNLKLDFSIGMEKQFKRSQLLGLYFIYSAGLQNLSESTVSYKMDNQTYTHTFSNNGNYAGLRLSYYFKPL